MTSTFFKDIYFMLCQKYPNRSIYVIGDHHFFHKNIVHYTRDNFATIEEMNQYIIMKHNKIVTQEDIVIFLGDFSFKNSFIKKALEQMNGHKYLILGNHDSIDLVKNYPALGFEEVFTTPIQIKDFYLSHEPLLLRERADLQFQLLVKEFQNNANGINYHGHIHQDSFISSQFRNSSCEVLDYEPIKIGQTTEVCLENKPLFINSSYFNSMIDTLKNKHNIEPSLLISDYIYSSILEKCNSYQEQFFVQGSFGLLKKYSFLSKVSDLDVSFLYDSSVSKSWNIELLKTMVDEAYAELKNINGLNLNFLKRFSSLRMLQAMYTSKHPYFSDCVFDTNLIFLDCYKKSDFAHSKDFSIIQKYLSKQDLSLTEEYHFPKFEAQFLTLECDIANLLLQILFQEGYKDRKALVFKKLQFLLKKCEYLEDFENIFTRFFLRNIAFLATMKRYKEISYIQNCGFNLSIFDSLPHNFKELIANIFYSDSIFLEVFNELYQSPNFNVDTCSDILRKLQLK